MGWGKTGLAAGAIFVVVFTAGVWGDKVLAAIHLPQPKAYQPLSGRIEGKYSKLTPSDAVAPERLVGPPTPALTAREGKVKIATIDRANGQHVICALYGEGPELPVTEYTDTRWRKDDAGWGRFRRTGCEKAMKAHYVEEDFEPYLRRLLATVPNTPEYAFAREDLEGGLAVSAMAEQMLQDKRESIRLMAEDASGR